MQGRPADASVAPATRFGVLSRDTMGQQIADRLITAIAVGAYTPGDRLPPERELADQLGVSRVTVRQALKIVTEHGLVSARRGQGGGTFVADPSVAGIGQTAQTTLERELPKLEELCEFRCLIEGTIARTAAERRTKTDIADLRRLLDEFCAAPDLSAARAADHRLHHQIARTSGNARLIGLSEQLSSEATLGFGSEPYPAHFLQRATDEHIDLVEHIIAGNRDGAFRAARAHYALTLVIMRDYLKRATAGAK